MKTIIKPFLIIMTTIILSLINCYGQKQNASIPEAIEIGKKYKFHSDLLNEERTIWVSLPEGYDISSEKYPVVYLLDGPSHFTYMAGLLNKFQARGVPTSILVGIANTKRTRDLTPPFQDTEKQPPSSGGADNFIDMLEKELIPFVDNNFRTKQYRTIIGHSFGGLLAIYSLATRPELVNAYLVISPSLWWDNQNVVDYFEKSLKENPEMKALLFLTMGNERGKMLGGMMKLVGVLESEQPANIRWDYKVHPDETHGTIPNISEMEGLEFFYRDWFMPSPVKEYLTIGIESFTLRAERIMDEFEETWDLKPSGYGNILSSLREEGKYREAINLGLELREKDQDCVRFSDHIASSYYALGNLDKAKENYIIAYKLVPGDVSVNKMLDSLGIDKSKILKSVKLTSKQIIKYTGNYELNPAVRFSVEISEEMLIIKNNVDKRIYKLVPMGSHRFYTINFGSIVEFRFEDNDEYPALILVTNEFGVISRAKRLE